MIHDEIFEMMDYDNSMHKNHSKPQFVDQYSTEHERLFMTREVNPITLKYATMMHVMAPKKCEKCNKDLSIPELCWREEFNSSNFLCYKCIGVLEKENAKMEHDGSGRLSLIEKE